jgi:hypothetical protein
LGGDVRPVLVAAASGSNTAPVPIIGAFAHRCTAKRDADADNIRKGNIGDGDVPLDQWRAVGTEWLIWRRYEKINTENEKLDTIADVRAGFLKRLSDVGVSLTSKGNTRRIILEVSCEKKR